MSMEERGSRRTKIALVITALLGCAAIATACSSGTSSADKTATAAKGAATAAATKAVAASTGTKAATTPVAAPTKAPSTPAAGTTQPSGTAGVKVGDTTLGKVLTNAKGLTLYTFKNDVAGSGKSAAEALAAVWPPLSLDAAPSNVAGATGAWTVFTRADGKKQVTYKGLALYTYTNDQAAGDTKGDKVGGVWFAAVP